MANLQNLVNHIHNLSSSPTDLAQLLTILKTQENVLQQNYALLGNALGAMDFGHHSLGSLFVLDVLTKPHVGNGDQQVVETITRFLRTCTEQQIRLAPDHFCSICRKLKDHVVALGQARVALHPLLVAIRKLQPTNEYLTPIHGDFLQLCLLSKCYNAAAGLLEDIILDVEPAKTAMTPTDLLLYAYYGGLVCAGRKQYARALEIFLQGLTAPTLVGNAIAVAMYQKYVLVALIHTGHVGPLPKFVSPKLKNVVEAESKAYNELAKAYSTHDSSRVASCVDQHREVLVRDTNLGLAQLVVQSLVKRRIQQLTQTFLTYSLTDIAAAAGLPGPADAELSILRMINSGEIHASINQKDGMVRFLEEPEQYNNARIAAKIDSQLRRCMALGEKMQAVNDMVTCDKAYLAKVSGKDRSRYEGAEDVGVGAFAPDWIPGGSGAARERGP